MTDYYKVIVLTFIVTALWDVCLRYLSIHFDELPNIVKNNLPFMKDLEPYFHKHTLLAAALIAGFVGATTQPIILKITPFPKNIKNTNYLLAFLTVSFIVSALYGFIMKWSGLFPHLQEHYYDKLGLIKGLYHDGISGLIVQITLLIMFFIRTIALK